MLDSYNGSLPNERLIDVRGASFLVPRSRSSFFVLGSSFANAEGRTPNVNAERERERRTPNDEPERRTPNEEPRTSASLASVFWHAA